jgi:phospholipid N-methyltransferase
MYIYNVTINVQEDVHPQWVKWMKEEHIPEMLNTGKFTKALMTRVLVNEEMGGITYSVQFTAQTRKMLQRYYEEDAERLRRKSAIFEGKFVVFRTELEVISEQ